jgi:predicted Zn-dependent protease
MNRLAAGLRTPVPAPPDAEDETGELRETTALAPRQARSHVHLRNVLRERGASPEAEYRAAITADPEEPYARYNLALVLSETGRLAEAEGEFRRAVALDPEDASGWRGLGETLNGLGRPAEARTALERARPLDRQGPRGKTHEDLLGGALARAQPHPGLHPRRGARLARDRRIEQDGTPEELPRVEGYLRQMMAAQDGESA